MNGYKENEIFNLVSGSKATGESTFDLWRGLGNAGDASDFLEYLKDDGESNVSQETLAQIEKNKNDIIELQNSTTTQIEQNKNNIIELQNSTNNQLEQLRNNKTQIQMGAPGNLTTRTVLVINQMPTRAAYEELLWQGTTNANELYLVPEE